MLVELTADELETLRSALASYLSDLRFEICDTDNRGYRETLRDERRMLEGVMRRLETLDVAPSPT